MNRFLLFGLAIASTVSSHTIGQTQVDKPQLAVGDRWTFRTVDLQKNEEIQSYEYRVTSISGDDIGLTRTTLGSATASEIGKTSAAKANGATWTFATARMLEGKPLTFAFPLDAGKTWEWEYKYSPTDGEPPGTWSAKAKVEGWEEVRVPAGTFKTLKVVHEGRWSRPYGGYSISGTSIETFWYAPEVKWFAKREYYVRRSGGIVDTNIRSELVSRELTK
jgi:hypothetical protein